MRTCSARIGFLLACAVAALACGLEVTGASPPPENEDAGPKSGEILDSGAVGPMADAGIRIEAAAPLPPAPACEAGACTTLGLDSGFLPVAVGAEDLAACPEGFTGALRVKSAPVAAAGACECTAAEPVPPVCNAGDLTFMVGTTCTSPGVTVNGVSGGRCVRTDGTLATRVQYNAFPATGGSCRGDTVVDLTKVATTNLTLCTPSACPDAICANRPPAGLRACIVTNGDVACSIAGFGAKQLVADDVVLTCSACTCTPSATCSAINVDLYSDNDCRDFTFNFGPNACTASGAASGTDVRSVRYTATATPSYLATGPKTATLTPSGVRTLCCPE